MRTVIDQIIGRGTEDQPADELKAMQAELTAEAAEPDAYRPYVLRSRPQLGFVLIEADGTRHGFQYHTLRHPVFERHEGDEFLSFHADGIAVTMQGKGLAVLHAALVRACLAEVREFDGRAVADHPTRIARLAVQDVQQPRTAQTSPRLVK